LEKYVYGRMPGRPLRTGFDVESQVTDYLDGKATRKWVRIDFGPAGASPIHLLLVVPNGASGSSPVILGLNFNGTHTVVPDTDIPLTTHWVRALKKGGPNEATEEGRGTSASRWPIAEAIERGYAVATFYQGDIDPDNKDLTNGIQSHYYRKGQTQPDPEEWGTIAAWAWGLHRAVDYLVTDPDIDPNKVVVMGHSRNGKTALVAGAFDPRIALTISNQSGCGGAAISRRRKGETVAVINRNFPHWFCGNFGGFDDRENFLPLDQHFLMAAIAPRPVLVCSAKDDGWADPLGEFEALQGAEPVYDLLGVDGLGVEEQPELNRLVGQRLGYHIRPGKHGVGSADWKVFMDFADEQWSSKP
ncbi:MAG: acetylxylan esterase, partial [Verrucomicrobiota bacterium]